MRTNYLFPSAGLSVCVRVHVIKFVTLKTKSRIFFGRRCVFQLKFNCTCFVEHFNGGLGMFVQASVCISGKSVCQVVINKDRNIGSPAVVTCLKGTCH